MSILLLPSELQDAVCAHLAPPQLAALSSSCSTLYNVAQRHLYRHIHLSSAFHNLSVVLTLARKPYIARHIRSFSITLASQSPVFHSYYRHLARALSHMTELSALRLFVDPAASWVLRETHVSRLQTFACSFPLDSHVAAFLQSTPALLELEVDPTSSHPHRAPNIEQSLIPHLQQFRGSPQVAEAIVPGRPVHTIHLTSGDLTEKVVARLAESAANIAILGATISSLPGPLLQLLSERMPYLMYLRIMTTYNFSEAPDVSFYEHVASALPALPVLQAFEMSGMHWGSLKNDENDMRVWQSQPIGSEQIHSQQNQPDPIPDNDTLDVDIYSELFVDY